ncbi:unnamed protein product [marine sediment metagenome]|uniref:Uracil-DNA glycosylase-like domain-containing protein n=1 Tax=marine sediment metagenome TaxID=412755 RepID=X0SZS4_9ZZZZ
MTRYQQHKNKWKDCSKCKLSLYRTQVVLARGVVPSPILFVGEAPGASEDVVGKPFVGPAGKLLDKIIKVAVGSRCTYALTNLVACIPKENGGKMGEPAKEHIRACEERLLEFIGICDPKLIVTVGKLAAKWISLLSGDWSVVEIIHPAAILRMDVSQKGLAVRRSIVVIEDALDSMLLTTHHYRSQTCEGI